MLEILTGATELRQTAEAELKRLYGPGWREILNPMLIEAYLGYACLGLADGPGFHESRNLYGGGTEPRGGSESLSGGPDMSFLRGERYKPPKKFQTREGGYPAGQWIMRHFDATHPNW
jgi:hypothetical protein